MATTQTFQGVEPERVQQVRARAAAFRERAQAPELEASERVYSGLSLLFWADSEAARTCFERSEYLFSKEFSGAIWELTNARGSLLAAWFLCGQLSQHAERTQSWVHEAGVRGDLFARTMYQVTGFGSLRHLLRDAPERGLGELVECMAPWRGEIAGAHEVIEAACGGLLMTYPDAGNALEYWAPRWTRLEKPILSRMPVLRELLLEIRLRSCLPGAFEGDEACRKEARRLARPLERGRGPWARYVGLYIRAQLAWLDGDRVRAAGMATEAADFLDSKGHGLHAPPARVLAARAAGAADAGDQEQRLLEWLTEEGFEKPERGLLWLLPAARGWR